MLKEMNVGLGVRAERLLAVGMGLAALATASSPAQAAILNWDFSKGVDYLQTANNIQPTTILDGFAEGTIRTNRAADITAANFNGTNAYFSVGLDWAMEATFPTVAALNTAFPQNTAYMMNITGGSLAPVSQTFTLGPDNLPAGVPFLTSNTFNDLQGMDPTLPFLMTMNSATLGGANLLGLDIFRSIPSGGEELAFGGTLDPGTTAFVLAADALLPGEQYVLELSFINLELPFPPPDIAGFNATGILSHERVTIIGFQTLPAPAAAALLGFSTLVSLRRRRA